MSDHIPTEIVVEILARLPVKTLLRFTVVCKLWYSIITNPNFITTHLEQFGRKTTEKLLLRLYTYENKKDRYLLIEDNEKFFESFTEINCPFDCSSAYFRIVGTCNGLICLCDNYWMDAEEVIVWNPCIRRSVTVTLPQKPPNPYMCIIGFGFDMLKNVFKIVRMIYEKECLNLYKVPPEVEVFEQGGEGWRVISSAPPQYCMVEFIWSQVFLNNSVHWLAYDPSNIIECHSVIVAFEMGYEVFKEISLPLDLASQPSTYLSVSLLKDSLVVFCYGEPESWVCSVWEMRDYGVIESWTNLYSIVLPGFSKALGFIINGEMLFMTDAGAVISYDNETNTITSTGFVGSSRSLKVQHFTESLVLLKGENDVPDSLHNFF